MPGQRTLGAIAASLLTLSSAATELRAQAAQDLTFEVASIRPASGTPNYIRLSPEPARFVAENVPLKVLIGFAYNLQRYQTTGGPGWIDSFPQNTYHIEAKAGRLVSAAELRQMVQALLAERFKLVVRHEMRDSQGFALTVIKGGHKLKSAKAVECPPKPTTCGGVFNFGGAIRPREVGERASVGQLASELSVILQSPVVDQTELTGLYDFSMEWKPVDGERGSQYYNGDPNAPELLTVIQEQLGLRLERQRIPTEFIVIEHIEEPSAN